MLVTKVPTNRICTEPGSSSLAFVSPLRSQLQQQPRDPSTCGATHPSSRGMGHIHPQHLPSHGEHARVSKTPAMPLACCHRPSHSISLYHFLCLEIPFHFPAAYGQQSSCATLSCVTTMQLPNQLRQKGKGGLEYRAVVLANILLSPGTEQTVAGYGANLLQERIFNIPLLQESLKAARDPQVGRCDDNNSSPRSALLETLPWDSSDSHHHLLEHRASLSGQVGAVQPKLAACTAQLGALG